MYTNSLLATLNARKMIRVAGNSVHTASGDQLTLSLHEFPKGPTQGRDSSKVRGRLDTILTLIFILAYSATYPSKSTPRKSSSLTVIPSKATRARTRRAAPRRRRTSVVASFRGVCKTRRLTRARICDAGLQRSRVYYADAGSEIGEDLDEKKDEDVKHV